MEWCSSWSWSWAPSWAWRQGCAEFEPWGSRWLYAWTCACVLGAMLGFYFLFLDVEGGAGKGVTRYSFAMKGGGITGSLRCGHDDRSHRDETCAIPSSVSHTPEAFLKLGVLRYIYIPRTQSFSSAILSFQRPLCHFCLHFTLHIFALFFFLVLLLLDIWIFFFGNTR
jgi:hypothetical protein